MVQFINRYNLFCRLPTVNQSSAVVIDMLNIDISDQLSVDAHSMKTYNFMKISFLADELKCIHDILRYILSLISAKLPFAICTDSLQP